MCAAVSIFGAATAEAKIFIGGGSSYIQATPLNGGKAERFANSKGDGIGELAASGQFVYWSNDSGLRNVGTINRVTTTARNFKSRVARANGVNSLTVSGRYLYFGVGEAIGRSTLLGSGANASFVAGTGVAVSTAVSGGFIYWNNVLTGSIGRANIDGSAVNPNFMPAVPGSVNDLDVAGGYIYWSNGSGTAIGRANIDGSNVNSSFITGMAQVGEIDVFGNFIYWTNLGGQIGPCDGPSCIPSSPGRTAGSIDRAKLDGSGTKSIVKRLNNPNVLAVTADPKRR